MKGDAGSVLAFEEIDKQCANHFLARRSSCEGYGETLNSLESVEDSKEASFYRLRLEGWDLLTNANSALAYTCILTYFYDSPKIGMMYQDVGGMIGTLQQKFEMEWLSVETCPFETARLAIHNLSHHLQVIIIKK